MRAIGSQRHRSRVAERAVSLPELLVVVSILALIVMVTIPIAMRKLHEVRLRTSAGQYVVALRAARMIAVSKRQPVTVTLEPCPVNRYSYVDARGRNQAIVLPAGVRIDPESAPLLLEFQANGSLKDPATTIIFSRYSRDVETWTVRVPASGIPTSSRENTEATGSLPCDNP